MAKHTRNENGQNFTHQNKTTLFWRKRANISRLTGYRGSPCWSKSEGLVLYLSELSEEVVSVALVEEDTDNLLISDVKLAGVLLINDTTGS